jgi:hypothetical protein
MFMEDQAFSPSSDMAPSLPQPPSSSDSKMSLFLSSSCVSPVELTIERGQGGGGGCRRGANIRRGKGFVHSKSFNTLWWEGMGENPNHMMAKKFGPL